MSKTMPDTMSAPPLARLTHTPFSAFALDWTYGPITKRQDRSAHLYAFAIDADVATIPGYWLMPPHGVR